MSFNKNVCVPGVVVTLVVVGGRVVVAGGVVVTGRVVVVCTVFLYQKISGLY